jgi:hypothetical protein
MGQVAGMAGVPNANAVATGIRGLGELAIDGQVSPATVAAALGQTAGRFGGPVAGVLGNVVANNVMGINNTPNSIGRMGVNAVVSMANPTLGLALGLLGVTGFAVDSVVGYAQNQTLNNPNSRDGIFGMIDGLNNVDYNDYDQGLAMQAAIDAARESQHDMDAAFGNDGMGVDSSPGNAPAGGMSGDDSGDSGPGDGYGGGV